MDDDVGWEVRGNKLIVVVPLTNLDARKHKLLEELLQQDVSKIQEEPPD